MRITVHPYLTVLPTLFFLLGCPRNAQASEPAPGKIEKYERGLHDTTRSRIKSPSVEKAKSENDIAGDSLTSDILEMVSMYALAGTYGALGYLPGESDFLYQGEIPMLSCYPYVKPEIGIYGYEDRDDRLKWWAVDILAQYFRGGQNLDGITYGVNLFPQPQFDLALRFANLREDTNGAIDHIKFADYQLNYRRLRWPFLDFYWGLGMKTIKRREYYHGLAFDAGLDVFPIKPVSLSYYYSGSNMGGAWASEHQLSARFHWKRFALRFGYQAWAAERVRIEGLFAGIELYH